MKQKTENYLFYTIILLYVAVSLFLIVGSKSACSAEKQYYFHTTSYHPLRNKTNYDHEPNKPLNAENYGIGIRVNNFEGGVFKNSLYRVAWYAMLIKPVKRTKRFELGYSYGLVTGYNPKLPAMPLVTGYAEYKHLRVMFLPDPKMPAFGFSLKF